MNCPTVNQFGWGRAITTVLILTLVIAFILVILYFGLLAPLVKTLIEITHEYWLFGNSFCFAEEHDPYENLSEDAA